MKHDTAMRFPLRARALPVLAAAGALTLALSASASASSGTTQQLRPADLGIVQAYVAGGVTSAQMGNPLTFVFSAKNFGPAVGDVSINLSTISGLDRDAPSSALSCVLPSGFLINPDGNSCEPGQIAAGRRAGSLILNGTVIGTGDVVVRACVSNLSGAADPRASNNCRTLRVTVV